MPVPKTTAASNQQGTPVPKQVNPQPPKITQQAEPKQENPQPPNSTRQATPKQANPQPPNSTRQAAPTPVDPQPPNSDEQATPTPVDPQPPKSEEQATPTPVDPQPPKSDEQATPMQVDTLQADTQVDDDVCMGTGEAREAKHERPARAPSTSTQSTPIKSPLYKRLKQLSPQHVSPKTKLFEGSAEQASFETNRLL